MREQDFLLLIVASLLILWGVAVNAGLSEGYRAMENGDFEIAREELTPLALNGDYIAAYYLGLLYWDGKGLDRDVEAAVSWLERSARGGHTGAQYFLAQAYERGEGVIQDYRLAAQWMAQAAEGGNSDAQYYLGKYYYEGRGIVQDDVAAYTWIHRAVEYGTSHEKFLDALLYLGAAYEWGRGVSQDLVEAYKWFALAGGFSADDVRTFNEAGRAMGALTTRLTSAELVEAQRRAENWLEIKRGEYSTDRSKSCETRLVDNVLTLTCER